MEVCEKLMMTYNDHNSGTKGIVLNTKTHVDSLGYTAIYFYEHEVIISKL